CAIGGNSPCFSWNTRVDGTGVNPASAERTVWRGHGHLARGGHDYYPEAGYCQESSAESCFRSVVLPAVGFHDLSLGSEREPNRSREIQFHFVEIAPPPAFARFDGPHNRMLGRVKMF